MDFRRWMVIDTADADKVNWRDPYMITNNAQTARYSNNGTKMLVSYNEVKPNSLNAIAGEELDRSQLEALMATADWYVEPGV